MLRERFHGDFANFRQSAGGLAGDRAPIVGAMTRVASGGALRKIAGAARRRHEENRIKRGGAHRLDARTV